MDNEKYGIELDLIWGKFKQKAQEVKKYIASIGNKKIDLNANTAQIENLKYQIERMLNNDKPNLFILDVTLSNPFIIFFVDVFDALFNSYCLPINLLY